MPALLKRTGYGLLALLGVLLIAAVLTARPGDPALWPPRPGAPTVEVYVISHGYHAGFGLPRDAVVTVAVRDGHAALAAMTQRFASYPWIEVGWGDEGFYRSVPDATSLTVALAVRALFRHGNASVVHVVGLAEPPRGIFRSADMVRLDLSEAGFARLLARLDASFARAPDGAIPPDLGPGLYGPSLFFRGADAFHIFNVCNHWVAQLLSAAGLPMAPVVATLPPGLLLDLKWRAGAEPLPRLN